MRATAHTVTDHAIRKADHIELEDPNNPSFSETLVGKDHAAPFVARGARAVEIVPLEIEVDSTNQEQLEELRDRVQQVRAQTRGE